MTDKLTEHFSLHELTSTTTHYDNTPPSSVVCGLERLAVALELVRSACGNRPIQVASGYRSVALNSAIGGAATSDHMNGLACDFTIAGLPLPEVMIKIMNSGMKYDQLIMEPTWIHIGIGSRMRQQSLYTADKRNYYEFIG
jgi:zinc D-Ala-D-Ala carboxypeptidase